MRESERVFSKKRVLYPYIATDKYSAKFKRTRWDIALNLIVEKLQETLNEYGPEKILILDYAGNRGLLTRYVSQRLWYLLRAARTDYSICDAAGDLGIRLHYGRSYGATIKHMTSAKLLIYWGFNAAVTSIHNFHLALKLRREKKTRIVVIDALKTETARIADFWLGPKFGTDTYLALGIANYIIEHELYDKAFIQKYTTGFEEFRKYISKFTLDYVEVKTGISKYDITRFAEMYVNLKPSVIFIGYGLQRRIGGGEAVRAICLLPALIGLHRGFYYSNTDGLLINLDYIKGTWLGKPSRIVPQPKVAKYLERGEFKFIYIFLTNPVATYPNAEALRRGLLRKDVFVVVHETHWTDTALCADIVLPAPTWLEKEDFVISYWHNYLGVSKRVLKPLGESKSEIEVIHEIAKGLRLYHDALFEDPLDILKKCLDEKTYMNLVTRGYTEIPYQKLNAYQTPSGKIEFVSNQANKMKLNVLPTPIDVKPPPRYPFILVSSASLKYTHTQFEDVYGDVPPIILISEEDMIRLGLRDGDEVIVESRYGYVRLIAKRSDKVPKGIVFTFRSCKTLDGKRINVVTSDEINELFGASLNSTFIRISKAK